MPTASRDIIVSNSMGLHARPAMQFVDLANSFKSEVRVIKPGEEPVTADGKSVMQMIVLEAIQGTPRVTPPPTDTISDATASSTGSWRIVLAGLAILIAIILVATQPTTRVRRTR